MIHVRIVTPDGVIYEDKDITSITLPTKSGIICVKRDHEPLVSQLSSGEINIEKDDYKIDLAISDGVLEVTRGSVVNILADTAERAEHIDVERAEEAKRRAEEYLAQKQDIADMEFARLQAKIEKELARINVARKTRRN